jgi:putative intracellular protease/amidase
MWRKEPNDLQEDINMSDLKGLKVAILIDDGFEQVEMVDPRKALDQAGAETRIVSPRTERVRGWNFTDWGDKFPVDVPWIRRGQTTLTRCISQAAS